MNKDDRVSILELITSSLILKKVKLIDYHICI